MERACENDLTLRLGPTTITKLVTMVIGSEIDVILRTRRTGAEAKQRIHQFEYLLNKFDLTAGKCITFGKIARYFNLMLIHWQRKRAYSYRFIAVKVRPTDSNWSLTCDWPNCCKPITLKFRLILIEKLAIKEIHRYLHRI